MAIDFPTSPTLNQVYTFNNISWIWNGSYWDTYPASTNVVNKLVAGDNITLSPSGGTGDVTVSSTISALTQTQRTSISSPYIGLIVYQTDGSDGLYVYKVGGWTQII